MPTQTLTFQHYEGRDTSGGRVHKFRTADGKYFDTWDHDVANQVQALMTKPCEVTYAEKVNAKGYTNYTIHKVAAALGAAQGGGGTDGSSEGRVAAQPPAKTDWEAKDQRITRSFAVNASLKALEIAGGDKNAAEQLLKDAIELAYLPSVYAWTGPQK